MYCAHTQDDWDRLLPQAELCYNTTRHTTTGLAPLTAFCGIEVRRSTMEPIRKVPGTAKSAESRVDDLRSIHEYLHKQIKLAQETQKKYYDRKRRPVDVEVGDKVYVKSKHLRTF